MAKKSQVEAIYMEKKERIARQWKNETVIV